MSVTATLQQEKITLSASFVAISKIISASPVGYYNVFLVSENIGDPTSERLDRVATLNDLATYVESPLNTLSSPGAFDTPPLSSVAQVGDILEITNAPAYWFDSGLSAAKFTVSDLTPDALFIDIDIHPFPTALDDVAWTLRDSTETTVRGSGTGAQCIRSNTGVTTYLRSHWTAVFNEVKAASDHVDSISAFVNALIDDANEDADQFDGIETEVIS